MLNQLAGIIFSETFVFSIFRITTPILFAALAAVIADRAGVTNIGLEGIMMICALTGVIFSAKLQSAWLGLLFAILLGVLTALMIGFFALKLKTDIILAGIAVNMLGNGGTIFVMFLVSGDRGYSANLASKVMPTVNIPILQDIPILGKILSGHNILTYFAFICVLLVWILLYKTPMGLQIRAVGESPNAADSVGVSVNRIKYIALGLSGALAGMGGAFMSMGYMSSFNTNMTAGRGFIALAAEAMGRAAIEYFEAGGDIVGVANVVQKARDEAVEAAGKAASTPAGRKVVDTAKEAGRATWRGLRGKNGKGVHAKH